MPICLAFNTMFCRPRLNANSRCARFATSGLTTPALSRTRSISLAKAIPPSGFFKHADIPNNSRTSFSSCVSLATPPPQQAGQSPRPSPLPSYGFYCNDQVQPPAALVPGTTRNRALDPAVSESPELE